MSNTNTLEALAEEIEQIATAHPHVAPLLQAFGPLLLEKERWLLENTLETPALPLDELRYQEGISLIQQGPIFLKDDPWQSAGLAVAHGIGQGFPHLAGDMARLSGQIGSGEIDCFRLIAGSFSPEEVELAIMPVKKEIDQISLQLFLDFLTKFMLTWKARSMAAMLTPLTWKMGYCPVCAGLPHLAILREHGKRWLQCSQCSHEWAFSRLTCPSCDHENPENSHVLFIEGQKADTAFTCNSCMKYLITSDRSGNLRQTHADLIALSLTHLDIILQDKGFLPMAEGVWNTFRAPAED